MVNEFDDFKNILASQKNNILTQKQQLEREKELLEQKKKEEERETERQYSINYKIFEESGILGVLNGIIGNNLLAGRYSEILTNPLFGEQKIKIIKKGKPRLTWSKDGSLLRLVFNEGFTYRPYRNFEGGREEYYDYIDFHIVKGNIKLVYKFGNYEEIKFIEDLNEIKKAVADVILRDSSEEKSIYKRHYDERT